MEMSTQVFSDRPTTASPTLAKETICTEIQSTKVPDMITVLMTPAVLPKR